MPKEFGTNFPALKKGRERERLMFLAAAGIAFSALLVFLVVFKLKDADAVKKPGHVAGPAVAPTAAMSSVALYTPTRFIRSGANLSEFEFREMYWPRNSVPEGAVRDRSELKDMYAAQNIASGVPITKKHLTSERIVSSLPISPGMRAVSIQVDSTSAVEGWARAGTRVDVVLTYNEGGELTSKVIVQNARVLSAGGDAANMDFGTGRRRVQSVRTITLEVTPGDALKIQTSRRLGNLNLIMRAVGDNKASAVTRVGKTDVDGGRHNRSKKKRSCNQGTIRMGGKEYVICDGKLQKVANANEP